MPVKFTTKGLIELWRDGFKVSQHTVESEAIERATADAEVSGATLYEIRYPRKEIDLSRLTRVIRDVDVTRPSTPTGLAATPVSETQINLSWNAASDPAGGSGESVSGLAGYKLYRNGTLRTTQATTSFSDTGLSAYTVYSYTVTAYDNAGNESVQSTPVTPRTLDSTAPSAPVIAASATSSSAISVSLTSASTDAGSGVATYTLQRATDAGFSAGLTTTNGLTAGSFPLSVSGLSASTQYFFRLRAVDVAGNTGGFSATVNATTQAGQQQGTTDIALRTAGPGVTWFHTFDSSNEVNAFRWTSAFGGGNDPNAVGSAEAGNVRQLVGGGPDGRNCLEIFRAAGSDEVGTHWWRPLSPIQGGTTSGNGRGAGQNDPGASGLLTPLSYTPTSGGSQIANWPDRGFYGHPANFSGSIFDGQEYFLQMRVKMDPRRASAGMPTVGKLMFQTRTDVSLTTQEIVTYSGGLNSSNPGVNYFRMYGGGDSNPLESKATNSAGGNQPNNEDGVCTLSANPNTCWAWSGGWDTILYHVIPGRQSTAESVIRVYAAHEGETSYTRIWDMIWPNSYGSGHPAGYNAIILSTYNNGNNCPSDLWHRYTDLIFSRDVVPCPKPMSALATACAALASGQSASFAPGTQHGLISEQLDWQARFFHGPLHDVVFLMGKAANNDDDWRLRIYDIAAGTWSTHDHNFARSGHVYASWDLDAASDDLYMNPGTNDTRDIWRRDYSTGAWSQLTAQLAGGSVTNGPNASVWHPNLYGPGKGGLVTCTQTSGTSNSLCYYRKSDGNVERTFLGVSVGGTSPQGTYFPGTDKVIIGRSTHFSVGMNTSSYGSTPVNANLGSPPLQTMGTASGTNHSVMLPHPGNYRKLLMLEKNGSNRYWESTDGDSWTLVGTHPFQNSSNNPVTFCSLRSGYGCIWGIGENGGSLTSVLWRPPV